jgi:pyruvate/2-oxoglutarate dehydrogenase complex dihydrolipoamide acyltransferase (E2) component
MVRDDETDTPASDEASAAPSPKKPKAARSEKGTKMKTTTKGKVGRPAKNAGKATKGKVGRPPKSEGKKAAAVNARRPVDRSGLDLHERVARPGTKKDQLFRLLYDKNKNKLVSVSTVLKALYGKEADENRGALNGVMGGVKLALEREKGLELRRGEGRGEEFSLGVFTTK